ncbi:MAG: hypothetical protein H6734_12960, partial [Alphaproteobacteria bacterium]|nr:hypothetical protein [Alphaproteobacteria bacterium]
IRGFDCAVAGSQVRYDGDYGALKVDVYADHLDVRFLALGDVEIDRFEVPLGGGLPTSTVADVPAQECTGCGCAAARTSGRWVILVAVGVPLLLLGARRRRRDD